MMKSRLVSFLSLLLAMLVPLMVLGSTGCGRGTSTPENEVWTRQFGTSDPDNANAMFSDGSGNIYVAGLTQGTFPGQTSSGGLDAFIAKYDSSGNEVWTRQFGTSGDDWPHAVVVDGSGNIYVTGWTEGGAFPRQTSSGGVDHFVAKYDTSGNEVWIRHFGTSFDDVASTAVAVGLGNIYVAGRTSIVKYDASGNEVWVSESLERYNSVKAMVADGLGNIYLAGDTVWQVADHIETGSFVAKCDNLGNEVWTRSFHGSDAGGPNAIFSDGSGNIYVAGWTQGAFPGQTSLGKTDFFIAEYDASGNQVSMTQFGTSGEDWASAMSSDGSGNIYMACPIHSQGFLDCYASTTDFLIAKYDISGDEVWRRKSQGLGENEVTAVVADGSGNIYVAGGIKGTFPGQTSSGKGDAFIMKLRE